MYRQTAVKQAFRLFSSFTKQGTIPKSKSNRLHTGNLAVGQSIVVTTLALIAASATCDFIRRSWKKPHQQCDSSCTGMANKIMMDSLTPVPGHENHYVLANAKR